jgi:ribose-phosphate pyrophosphokinase
MTSAREIAVFSGSAHPALAEAICCNLGIPLLPSSTERFSNDCLEVQLLGSCRERDVFLIQPLVPPVQQHLMELLFMLDAARGASASRVTAVIPYYAYARSDKKDKPRISIGGRLVADLLVAAGAGRVLTVALHSPQVHGFFSVPVDNLTALGVLADHFSGYDLSRTVIVSPDLGNAKSATMFARLLNAPVAAGSKRRFADDRVLIDTIVGEVDGHDIIVLDDEIANGGTVVELIRVLRTHEVGRIAVACTHGLFTGAAIERLSRIPEISEVVTTDTVPVSAGERLPGMCVLSVAPLLSEAIRRIHDGESLSSLFATN